MAARIEIGELINTIRWRPAAMVGESVPDACGTLLDRFAARRQEAGGLGDVDVRDEQPLLAVGLVAEQRICMCKFLGGWLQRHKRASMEL